MRSLVLYIMVMIWFIVIFSLRRISSKGKDGRSGRPSQSDAAKRLNSMIKDARTGYRPPRSTDGHKLRKDQDITCRRFGHRHSEEEEPAVRFIVHDDIEDGYIILNGKKMHRTEADAYENTI